MNKLSTKDNKNYCVCVAMLAIINVFICIYRLATYYLPNLKWNAHNIAESIYNIISLLSNIIAMTFFIALALLVALQAFNLCGRKLIITITKTYIILYTAFAVLSYIVQEGYYTDYWFTFLNGLDFIMLITFIIIFAKSGERIRKLKIVFLILVLFFLILHIMALTTYFSRNTDSYISSYISNIDLLYNFGQIILSIIMVMFFWRNQMDSIIVKIVSGLFLLLSFIDGISLMTAYGIITAPIFISFLFTVLQALPLFLYFLFYRQINTPCDSREKIKGIEAQLTDLKEKFDSGVITLDEYNIAKQNILRKINSR